MEDRRTRFCCRWCREHGLECRTHRVGDSSAYLDDIGSHPRSLLLVLAHSANAFALFVKSQRRWSSPPLTEENIISFKARMKEFGYSPGHVLVHGSYLINLGNPDK